MAEVLDELPDDAGRAQDLGHRQHQVGGRRALAQLAGELEPHHLRHEHRERLAEHRRLGLDPADAPAEHAEAVHHRRVRVGSDERVRKGLAVARLDHAREVLEVHLVADAGAGRHDAEPVERGLAPAQEGVALAVPLHLEVDVAAERDPARERVHLHRVVDHEVGGEERVDPRRVAAEVAHGVAHRGEVDDRGHAGEVLEEDARRYERDVLRRLGLRVPARDRLHAPLVARPEAVLEQDPERVGQARDVVAALERVEPEDLVALASGVELGTGSEAVGHRS